MLTGIREGPFNLPSIVFFEPFPQRLMHIGRNHKGALIHGKHKLAQAYALHAVHHAKEHRFAASAIHALRGNSRNPAFLSRISNWEISSLLSVMMK